MILQALNRYFQLLLEREGDSMPREEYSSADVSFEIHLNENGHVVAIIPYVNEKGKIDRRKYNVPKQEKRTSGIKPYFLCDKAEYLFGSTLGADMRETCREAMKSFWKEVLENANITTFEIQVIYSFLDLESEQLSEQLHSVVDKNIQEMLMKGGLCVLKYAPTGKFFHSDHQIQHAWESYCRKSSPKPESGSERICLITGEKIPFHQVAKLHPDIKGVSKDKAPIVSFNIESFCSYGFS